MSVILTHSEQHEDQKLEITVVYTPKDNTVEEVLSVQIDTPVGMISVSDLFLLGVAELCVAIDKIISRVDWHEIYRQEQPDMQDAA
jgi:hypothetical protein